MELNIILLAQIECILNNNLLINYGRLEEHVGSSPTRTVSYPCSYQNYNVGFCTLGCSVDGELIAPNAEGNYRVLCSLTNIKINLNVKANRSYFNWITIGY